MTHQCGEHQSPSRRDAACLGELRFKRIPGPKVQLKLQQKWQWFRSGDITWHDVPLVENERPDPTEWR